MTAAAQPTSAPEPGKVTNLAASRKEQAAAKKAPAAKVGNAVATSKAPAEKKQDPNKMTVEQRRTFSRAMADCVLEMDLAKTVEHYPVLAGLSTNLMKERLAWQAAYILPPTAKPTSSK
jgi:hypothetical protein